VSDCKNLPDYETLTLRIHHSPKPELKIYRKEVALSSLFVGNGTVTHLVTHKNPWL
jgi:hypothetical protein